MNALMRLADDVVGKVANGLYSARYAHNYLSDSPSVRVDAHTFAHLGEVYARTFGEDADYKRKAWALVMRQYELAAKSKAA